MIRWDQRATIWALAVTLVIIVVLCSGTLFYLWPRTQPERVLTGSVMCTSGAPVVGIWVGQERSWLYPGHWADRQTTNGKTYYNSVVSTERYYLHVGCGGTPQNWKLSTTTGFITADRNNFVCQDRDDDPRVGLCLIV